MIKNLKCLITMFIFLSFFVIGTVTAAGTGVLSASNASDVALGESATVAYTLANDFNPKVGTITYNVYYDDSVITATSAVKISSATGVVPSTLKSGMTFSLVTVDGLNNGDDGLYNITFQSLKNDGSSTELGIVATVAGDVNWPPNDLLGSITIINGTFSTEDKVAPVINNITTSANVAKDFKITGYITEVGGMGSANATLVKGANSTYYDLTLNDLGNGLYSYTADASWAIFEDGITLTVNAVDAKGNVATPSQKSINVVNAGFTDPSPEGYLKSEPSQASAFMTNINNGTVKMTIGGGAIIPPADLPLTFQSGDTGYVFGNLTSLLPLIDGEYWINASGTDTITSEERSLNWTFTLDTTTPTLAMTVTDSDGDGYIEANEDLTFNWAVTSPGVSGFKNVEIVDKTTSEVLWNDTNSAGTSVQNIAYGNRELSFRAYDNAGNYAADDFHLYNNYIVWVNSTKFGTISGIETNYTAMISLDLTASSNVALLNGSSVSVPNIGTVTRKVTNTGQVTSDTYVTVDNKANATYPGTDTYQSIGYYGPDDVIDFEITAPEITHANVLLMEANESYISQLVDQGSTKGLNYTELIKKVTYIFIDGGWAKITVLDDGTFQQTDAQGAALTTQTGETIVDTLKRLDNQVDLTSGYRLSTDCVMGNRTIMPEIGDYAVAALAFDSERIGAIGVMPIVITETNDQGSISSDNVAVNGTFDASFSSDCKYFGVGVYRDSEYNASALIDFSKMNADMITVELTADGVPATEKLWHNIYISPDSGKYAYVKENNTLTFDVTGLKAGNYVAVLAGLSNNGTAQALGVHSFTIALPPPVANFTATPLNGYIPQIVEFTDESTTASEWNWNFGDGNTSTVQNPTHTYVTVGTYSVSLTVKNSVGTSTKTRTNYIIVLDTPPVNPDKEENVTLSDPGTSVSEVGGVQQVTFNTTQSSGGQIVGNNIVLSNSGINVTIMTNGLTQDPNGNWIGNVTGVRFDGAPVTTAIGGTVGNATFTFNGTMPGYNPNTVFDISIYNKTSTDASTKFSVVAKAAGKQINSIAYSVYIVKKNLTATDKISDSYLTFTASPAWVNANGGTGAITIMREADNGTCQFLTTTYLGLTSSGDMNFMAYSPDGFSSFAMVAVSAIPSPTPVPTPIPGPSGGGGGGGGGGYSGGFGPTVPSYQYTSNGVLTTNSLGQVEGNVEITSVDGGAQLLLSNGVQAFDANGRALSEVSIEQSTAGATPGTSGALYKFGDFVYNCLPAGATFDPSIDIKFELTETQFSALNPGQTFSVQYYDEGLKSWVEVPTYVNPNTREVIGEVEHFTYYALMAVGGTSAPVVPGAGVTPTEQPTIPVEPTEPVGPSEGGMPGWIWIVLIVVIIAVAGAAFYLYKEGKIGGSNS